jgi:hypothetical protein
MHSSRNRQWRREQTKIQDAAPSLLRLQHTTHFSPTIPSVYYCCQRDSNHILCNFSTKFHFSNLIIVLTFPFLLACTLPTAPCTSKALSRLQRPQLQTPPSTNGKDQSHSHSVTIPESNYSYLASYLIHSQYYNELFLNHKSQFKPDMTYHNSGG